MKDRNMKSLTEIQRRKLYGKTGSHYTKRETRALRKIFIDSFNSTIEVSA